MPVYSLDEYMEKYDIENTKFVISVSNKIFVKQIVEQLKGIGVLEEHIISIADWRNNTSQYFDIFRRLRNATTRLNTAFFVYKNKITPHRIWYNRVDEKLKTITQERSYSDTYDTI